MGAKNMDVFRIRRVRNEKPRIRGQSRVYVVMSNFAKKNTFIAVTHLRSERNNLAEGQL